MFYSIAARPVRSFHRAHAPAVRSGALEQFLSDAFSSLPDAVGSKSASMEELEKVYSIQLDVPGLAREQLDIGIEGDVVRVTSKEDAPRKVKAGWRFPLEIDAAASSARLEHGVLSLTLAKKIPVSQVARLDIQ